MSPLKKSEDLHFSKIGKSGEKLEILIVARLEMTQFEIIFELLFG